MNQQLGDEVVLSSGRKEGTAPDESTKDILLLLKQLVIPEKFNSLT